MMNAEWDANEDGIVVPFIGMGLRDLEVAGAN